MMKTLRIAVLLVMAPVLAEAAVKVQQNAAPSPAPANGFRGEFLANLDEVQDKILDLAESTPAEKFTWRPANDVRSISEVYMHVAGGNYFLASFLGVDAPPRARDLEKTVTKKADVLAELSRSFDHLRAAVMRTDELEKPVKLFGKPTTNRGVLVTIISHLHEHLGQAIAYARMNGVVPPWSH